MTLAAIDKDNVVMGKDLGKKEARLELTTFQKIANYAALASTGKVMLFVLSQILESIMTA